MEMDGAQSSHHSTEGNIGNIVEDQKFAGTQDADQEALVAIEVFCGCARLSSELQREGFEVVAVDWRCNKDMTEVYSQALH